MFSNDIDCAVSNFAAKCHSSIDYFFLLPVPAQPSTEQVHTIFDCSDLVGITESGVYTLLSDGASHSLIAKDAYCDMETDGGG